MLLVAQGWALLQVCNQVSACWGAAPVLLHVFSTQLVLWLPSSRWQLWLLADQGQQIADAHAPVQTEGSDPNC